MELLRIESLFLLIDGPRIIGEPLANSLCTPLRLWYLIGIFSFRMIPAPGMRSVLELAFVLTVEDIL